MRDHQNRHAEGAQSEEMSETSFQRAWNNQISNHFLHYSGKPVLAARIQSRLDRLRRQREKKRLADWLDTPSKVAYAWRKLPDPRPSAQALPTLRCLSVFLWVIRGVLAGYDPVNFVNVLALLGCKSLSLALQITVALDLPRSMEVGELIYKDRRFNKRSHHWVLWLCRCMPADDFVQLVKAKEVEEEERRRELTPAALAALKRI